MKESYLQNGSSPRMRHMDNAPFTVSPTQSRPRRPYLPSVLEEGHAGPSIDSYYLSSRGDTSMFEHWKALTEQFNTSRIHPDIVRDLSFLQRRGRNGSAMSGRSSPTLSVASAGGKQRTRSQMSHKSGRGGCIHARQESKRSGISFQRPSHSNYAGSHMGDSDPDESSSLSNRSDSSSSISTPSPERLSDSDDEDELSMDEKVPIRARRPAKKHKHHKARSRRHPPAPPMYLPQPIMYQMPFSMYPHMQYYYPPAPLPQPMPMHGQFLPPPVLPLHPTPFASGRGTPAPRKREVGTQARSQTAPTLPKPIAISMVPESRPESPDGEEEIVISRPRSPPAKPALQVPVALEIGLSETKSLAEIFKEKRRDFDRKASERKVSKIPHTDKTPAELLKLRKDMLKGVSSLSSKDSEDTTPLTTDVDVETDRKKKEPNPELLERLASGKKAKVSKKEMLELTKRNYEALPEVVRKKEEEQKRAETLLRIGQKKEYERVRSMQHLQELKRRAKDPPSPSSLAI